LPGVPPVRCGHCGYRLYVNARPTGTVIIVRGTQFLAVQRAIEPKFGRWELPGGFCDGWEHPSDAAVREAREELGVTVVLDQFVGMYLGSYEFQDELLPVLDCFWLATIVAGEIELDRSESSAYEYLSFLDPPPMAFATMDRALIDARKMV
jgi:8-oxo-dGTP diphosphatase